MTKFLAVHPLPAPATVEEATPLGKKAKANATVDAYWVRSWCPRSSHTSRLCCSNGWFHSGVCQRAHAKNKRKLKTKWHRSIIEEMIFV